MALDDTLDELLDVIKTIEKPSFRSIPDGLTVLLSDIDRLVERRPETLDALGEQGETLLTAATRVMSGPLMRHLLLKGANINVRNRKGETALFIAAYRSDLSGVHLLSLWNPDPNLRDNNQRSALHLPANHGDIEMVRRLIEMGADAEAEDAQGMTPLHMVRSAAGILDVRNGTLPDDPIEIMLKSAQEIRAKILAVPAGSAGKPVKLAAPLRLKHSQKPF